MIVLYFNPRPREEGDATLKTFGDFHRHFNPRPREEGDSFLTLSLLFMLYFNPRPREEGDRFIVYIIPFLCISIHALVKRATPATRM